MECERTVEVCTTFGFTQHILSAISCRYVWVRPAVLVSLEEGLALR
jgi:hypothetical protein